MERQLTFYELKQRVSIIQIADDLGYKFDASKGLIQPSFYLKDGQGNTIDRIFIKNPKNNAIQGYWRHSVTGKNSGDLIDFIKENLHKFSEGQSARNDIDAINKILNKYAGTLMSFEQIAQKHMNISNTKDFEKKDFDVNRYPVSEEDKVKRISSLLEKRNISAETAETFSPFIAIIQDANSKYNYKNLGFPYTIPGENKTVGYEVRGMGGYKGKATGTDSTNALWIADFSKEPNAVRTVFLAESALDIMAFYQINKNKIDVNNSVFCSMGGSFSANQFSNVINHYKAAKVVCCFDNDINGKMYDARAYCLMNGKELKSSTDGENVNFTVGDKQFNIPIDKFTFKEFLKEFKLHQNMEFSVWKAPGEYKDWNDVLLKPKDKLEIENKYDYTGEEKRQGTSFKR